MEKSRAIELLEHLAWDRDIDRNPYGDALNMAIEALKAQLLQKDATKDATSDLISRQEAIDALKHNQDIYSHNFHDDPIDKYTTAIIATDIDTLVKLPTIQPEPHYDEWCDTCKEYDHERHCCPRWNHVIRTTLQDVQPEPKWIPVSERLPEDIQYVLLTVRRLNNAYNSTPFISVGYIGWDQTHWWCAHDGDCEISKVAVIAWMPLPKPFEGGIK